MDLRGSAVRESLAVPLEFFLWVFASGVGGRCHPAARGRLPDTAFGEPNRLLLRK